MFFISIPHLILVPIKTESKTETKAKFHNRTSLTVTFRMNILRMVDVIGMYNRIGQLL